MKYILLLLLSTTGLGTFAQNIGGIGAVLILDTTKDGYTLPRIKSIVPNSPASIQSVPESAYILQVNDYPCKNKSLEEVVGKIRGEVGTAVKLSLADNPQGRKAKNYNIVRGAIQTAPNNTPPPDPMVAFNDFCAQQTRQIRKEGHEIIKKFTSECGDYFFSFEAEDFPYHARILLLEDMEASKATAVLYDNSDEHATVSLKQTKRNNQGFGTVTEMEATTTLKRHSVGVVRVKIDPLADAAKCKGMYIVVYK